MADEIDRILRSKYPSHSPRAKRKSKLKMRYGKDQDALAQEIRRTNEKLQLLVEIFDEQAA